MSVAGSRCFGCMLYGGVLHVASKQTAAGGKDYANISRRNTIRETGDVFRADKLKLVP